MGLNIQKKVIKNLRKALRLNEKIVNDEDEDNIESITYNFTEIIGNTFVQTPTWLDPKKCTINPQNDDNKCFQYAVTLFYTIKKLVGIHLEYQKLSLSTTILTGIILIFHHKSKIIKHSK